MPRLVEEIPRHEDIKLNSRFHVRQPVGLMDGPHTALRLLASGPAETVPPPGISIQWNVIYESLDRASQLNHDQCPLQT